MDIFIVRKITMVKIGWIKKNKDNLKGIIL